MVTPNLEMKLEKVKVKCYFCERSWFQYYSSGMDIKYINCNNENCRKKLFEILPPPLE